MDIDLTRAALIVLDLQGGILSGPFAPYTAQNVVDRAAALASAVRDGGGTVILVNVGFAPDFADAPKQPVDQPLTGDGSGPDWYDFPKALGPKNGDIVITKRHWGAFLGTELDLQLRRRGVDTVVLCGYATNLAVESTARGAWERGYRVVFAEDACASFSAEMHDFAFGSTFPHLGHVRYAESIIAAARTESPSVALSSYPCIAGRNAIITGGCGPIGIAIVRELARLGSNVAIADPDAEAAEALAAQVTKDHGIKAIAIAADTSDPQACKQMIAQTLKAFGSLHLAANAAGGGGENGQTAEQTADAWRAVTAAELDACFYSIKHEAPAILRSGGGAIVNIGSVYGHIGQSGNAIHSAAKHGVAGLTRSTALEYARQGVRVNMVSPGRVRNAEDTMPVIPPTDTNAWLGRSATADEIAAIVVFALSDNASYLIGADLLADGGLSLE